MKELIYLDTDFLHSFLAQTQGGLATETTNEYQELESNTKENTQGKSSQGFTELVGNTGKIKIPYVLETPEGKITLHYQPGKHYSEKFTWQDTDIGKEVIRKQLHDNALNEFEKYLEKNNLLNKFNHEDEQKGFVEINSNFDLIDFDIFNLAFSEEMAKTMLQETRKEIDSQIQIIEENPNISANQKKTNIKKVNAEYKKIEEKIFEELSGYREMLNLLKKFLPSSVFLRAGTHTIIPLKDSFLRGTRNELTFKYGRGANGSEVKVLGKITRQINVNIDNVSIKRKKTDPFERSFEEFAGVVDEMLVSNFNLIPNGAYVIHPIAVYFE